MPVKVCNSPGCGALIALTERHCARHAAASERARISRRGDRYGAKHRRLARQCIKEQPWCTDCNATDDLTADHTPHGYQTRCRGCNSARANRARGARTALQLRRV